MRDQSIEREITWGGWAWKSAARDAWHWMGDLKCLRVLELGFRSGNISRLFARKGAVVTGVETDAGSVAPAQAAADLEELNCRFLSYSGNLDQVPGEFDIVFSKSVLVLTDIDEFVKAIHRKLAPGGRIVCIENGRGNWAMRLARRIRHPRWDNSHVEYFTQLHVKKIRDRFDVRLEREFKFPPVYLVCGVKR